MSESSQTQTRDDLRRSVGWQAGYGLDPDDWDEEQTYNVDRSVDAGLMAFYKPDPDQAGAVYEWTFLTPYREVLTVSGENRLDLPDDYAGFVESRLRVTNDDTSAFGWLELGEAVRGLYARASSASGVPSHGEVALATNHPESRTSRYWLYVYPRPDAAYRLGGRMAVDGAALSDRRQYVYGNANHSRTIEAACLAMFETLVDQVVDGPRSAHFRQRLRASIADDMRKKPRNLGFNRDHSDALSYRGRFWPGMAGTGTATIDGLDPSA